MLSNPNRPNINVVHSKHRKTHFRAVFLKVQYTVLDCTVGQMEDLKVDICVDVEVQKQKKTVDKQECSN